MNLQALQCYQMIVVNYTLKRIYPKILYLWTKKVVRNIAMAKKKSFTTTGWPGCSLSTCFSFGSWHSRPKLPSLPRSLVGRWSPFGCSGLHSAEKERPEGFLREQQPSRYLMRLSPFTRPKVAEAALRSAIPSVVDDSELKGKAKPEPSLSASFPFFEVPIDKRI